MAEPVEPVEIDFRGKKVKTTFVADQSLWQTDDGTIVARVASWEKPLDALKQAGIKVSKLKDED